jgi:hypothetical protein
MHKAAHQGARKGILGRNSDVVTILGFVAVLAICAYFIVTGI